MFVLKGPNTDEFQLIADSVASLRNLVAKIAEGLPPRDESESAPSQKSYNVCITCNYCCSMACSNVGLSESVDRK